MKNNKTRWILIAVVAALVAAATTVLVLVLRARAKKKVWYEEEALEYDCDDCDVFECDDEAFVDEVLEEIVED